MKNRILQLWALTCLLCCVSCKTQYPLKHQLYLEVFEADRKIDTSVIRHYSRQNARTLKADDSLRTAFRVLDEKSLKVHNAKLRLQLRYYAAIGDKIVLLHEDRRMNSEELGALLDSYTHTLVAIREQLTAYQ